MLKSDLYPYQQEAVKHITNNNSAMLWLDIGLGKTIISLTAIEYLMDAYKIRSALVLGPLQVIESVWAQEAAKWNHTRRLTFSMVRGTPKERLQALQTPADVYLTNYEQIQWLAGALQEVPIPFAMVVFDEISKMKTSTAKRVRAFGNLLPHCTYRVGLTGSPAANGLIDLHGQYLMVDGGYRLGPNITGYRNRWFDLNAYSNKYIPRRSAAREIQDRISDITLEMKSSDYLQLPPVVTQDIIVPLTPALLSQYQEFEKDFFVSLDNGAAVEAFSAAGKGTKCRQLANGAVYTNPEDKNEWEVFHDLKLVALDGLIEQLQGKPLLLAYQFRHDKARLAYRYPECVFLSDENTAECIARWNRGEIRILAGHPASMGHGLNLQAGGNHIAWFGLDWSLELYDQTIGRLARNGQEASRVVVHRIIAQDTIEHSVIAPVLSMKSRTQADLRAAIDQYRKGLHFSINHDHGSRVQRAA